MYLSPPILRAARATFPKGRGSVVSLGFGLRVPGRASSLWIPSAAEAEVARKGLGGVSKVSQP